MRHVNIQAQIGIAFPTFPQHLGPYEVFQAGTGFSVPIFDLTLWRRWQASKASVTATGAEEQTVREQIAALVVSQYLGSLRAAVDAQEAQSSDDLSQTPSDQ